ncbi:hypothetical protein GW17_00015857 [Ensete ventricosum]|nr:hypothetical protein GW17_00015857 [Ensete ventricosum]
MESARPLQPKVPSPTYSVASKGEPKQHTVEQSPHIKEGEAASEVKATNNDMNFSDKKAVINTPASEDMPGPLSKKGPKLSEGAPVPEDAQEKQLAGEQAADMQWKSYQDLGAENYGMPLAASGYNPYWAGGMPMGVDGYMAPFGGAMPFMGYTPGPFDIPYGGGIFPQDPFAAQAFMMPAVPRIRGLQRGTSKADRWDREQDRSDRYREQDRDRGRDRDRDRSEKTASVDRRGPARDPPRHSPPRPRNEPTSDAERKHKASVFSRICFPDPGEAASKKKKKPSSFELPPRNGLKEPTSHKAGPEGHRDEPKGRKSSSTSTRKGGGGYDHESSEEEYHFKRRPSSSTKREAAKADREEEEDPRPSKRSRERQPHERGGRERAHGHQRPASRRR